MDVVVCMFIVSFMSFAIGHITGAAGKRRSVRAIRRTCNDLDLRLLRTNERLEQLHDQLGHGAPYRDRLPPVTDERIFFSRVP